MLVLDEEKYTHRGKIGFGTYGVVYLAVDRKGIPYAIKKNLVDKHNVGFSSMRELNTAIVLGDHPNIVRTIGISACPFSEPLPKSQQYADDKYWIVYGKEDLDAREFFRSSPQPSVQEKKSFAVQAIEAVAFVHFRLLFHLDIKPDNFLVSGRGDRLRVRLCDLGMSSEMNSSQDYCKGVMTIWYRAPELLKGFPYDEKADLYALAVTILEVFKGSSFMKSTDEKSALSSFIRTYPLKFTQSDIDFLKLTVSTQQNPSNTLNQYIGMSSANVSLFNSTPGDFDQFTSMLTWMMRIDPVKRYNIVGILHHPFMASYSQHIITRSNDIAKTLPPALDVLRCVDCVERRNIASFLATYESRSQLCWYSSKMLFLAMNIFDRFLWSIYSAGKTPSTTRKESDQEDMIVEGGMLTVIENRLLVTTCIYMALKYFVLLSHAPPLTSILPKDVSKTKGVVTCMILEDKILNEFGFRTYHGTLYTWLAKSAHDRIGTIITNYINEGPKLNGTEFKKALTILIAEKTFIEDLASPREIKIEGLAE